jgi:hypothetical protein
MNLNILLLYAKRVKGTHGFSGSIKMLLARFTNIDATNIIKSNIESRDIKETNPRRGELEIQSIYWSNIQGLACLMRSNSFT